MRISFNKEVTKKEPIVQPGLISNPFFLPLSGIVSEDLFLVNDQEEGQNFNDMNLEAAFAETLQHLPSDHLPFEERNNVLNLPLFSEGPSYSQQQEEDTLQDDIFNLCFPM